MTNDNETGAASERESRDERAKPPDRPAYEPPRILKKRSVARVTLYSGSGPMAGGLAAGG